jgi:hypothetical protein
LGVLRPATSSAFLITIGRPVAMAIRNAFLVNGPTEPDFYRRAWMPALEAVGLAGVHLHDLRHTGNQLSADAGANIREMMERMGHDSMRAALIYLHAPAGRQRVVADQVGKDAKTALSESKRSGTRTAARSGVPSEKPECARQDSNPRPAA